MDSSATVTDGRLAGTIADPSPSRAPRGQAALFATVVALAAGATLLVTVLSVVELTYRSASAHVAIETAATLIPLFAGYLVWGRYRRSPRTSDLALLGALGVATVTNVFFSAIPAIAGEASEPFATWAALGGRMLAAAALVAAAFVPAAHIHNPRRAALKAALACTAALALLAALVALLDTRLPAAIDPGLSPEAADRPRVTGDAPVLAWLAGLMLLFAVAAVGFARRGARERDELMTWFGAGSVFASFAYLNYFLFPSLFSDWVYTGDILRLCFLLVLLFGAAREIAGYQAGLAEAAVMEERRRMARDLHDGLAQELAFIGSQSKRLAAKSGESPPLEQLAAAADRALDESRDVISALTRPLNAPLDASLTLAAESAAHRFGTPVELDLTPDVHVSEETSQQLCRIVREAITNACRHGECDVVRVSLGNENGSLRLAVADDGHGFDPARRGAAGGFGLTSMKERAQRIGGALTVRSRPGEGAEVEVLVP